MCRISPVRGVAFKMAKRRFLGTHPNRSTKVEGHSASFPTWKLWGRQVVYRTTCYRTTWRFRLPAVALLPTLPIATRGWWVPALGWSLVSNSGIETPDLILIDNLDRNFHFVRKGWRPPKPWHRQGGAHPSLYLPAEPRANRSALLKSAPSGELSEIPIMIYAVMHMSRHPDYWMTRL